MLKTLKKQVKGYWFFTIITPIMMILEVVFEMSTTYLIGELINRGVYDENFELIIKISLLMLLCAVGGLVTGAIGGITAARASTGFATNLRATMFNNIQNFSFKSIDKYSTAGLVTRLTTDVTNVQNAFQMIIRMFVRAPMSLITAMAFTIIISPKIALVYLGAIIFLVAFIGIIMPLGLKYFRQVFEKYDALNESVQENISSIRVVKAFIRGDHETEKFHKASNNIYQMFVKAEKLLSYSGPVMNLAVNACILIISWLGAHYVIGGELLTGDVVRLLNYCMNILMSLMMLSMVFVMITMSQASAKRITEVILEESDIVNPENPLMSVDSGSVLFEKVDFKYKEDAKENVLEDISLEIKSGQTVGIIGDTGSGKSTLVSLISRFYDVTSGSIKVAGHDVREYNIKTLRNNVSMVLQKNELFSGTIYDNLRWGDENATDEECQLACKRAMAHDFITSFTDGYNTWIEQGGTNVSGGQKQRLCIARALLKKPKILILDDSTSAVDTATDAAIRKTFREDLGDMTKIIISQRVSSIIDADQIIVLNDGKISAIGTHEELLDKSEEYASIYESQTKGGGDFDEGGER